MANVRIKAYPDGTRNILVANAEVWNAPPPVEGQTAPRDASRTPAQQAKRDAANAARAMSRARQRVRDICLCSAMDVFVTLTLDKEKISRYDPVEVVRKTRKWLDNGVSRGLLRCYCVVPELHKDGAVHWHGLFRLGTMSLVDSGTVAGIYEKPARPRSAAQRAEWMAAGGHVVYNLPAWPYGFSTALQLYGEYRRAVGYVCKYIGKGEGKVGGRWYYSGGEKGEPDVTYICAEREVFVKARESENVKAFDIPNARLSFVDVSETDLTFLGL